MIRLAVVAAVAAAGPIPAAAGGMDFTQLAISQGGAFLGMLIMGYGWKRERDRADAERKRSAELADALIERVVPALEGSTRATEELVALRRERHR